MGACWVHPFLAVYTPLPLNNSIGRFYKGKLEMAKKTKQPKIQKAAIKRLASENAEIIKQLEVMDDRMTSAENRLGKLERENRDSKILKNHEKGLTNKESANELDISPSRVGQIIRQHKQN
ncbi:hypothetical protein J7438_07145 [Thalassotalea sp. G20_0]|uniref:hypothetical protein n=1 Tax=Thalassotalea sp. G20_0 TaxID=2821093 RepID=UPI001ADC4E4C|nr:hypothetical protein [Thalassotalea sp. G20_0]MBO9493861.1 hypothetical protein [Thalassotalea sp. G20_0]